MRKRSSNSTNDSKRTAEEGLFPRVVLVTGAGRSIGLEIARAFVATGATVYGIARTASAMEEMATHGIIGNALDVRDRAGTTDLVRSIRRSHGRLDCLVNNAAIATRVPLSRSTDDEFDALVDVNVKGIIRMSRAYYSEQRIDGGVIVNVASIAGMHALKGSGFYGATKAAAIHLTKSMAAEWGRHGFRVNAVCPGIIQSTDGMAAGPTSDDSKARRIAELTSLKRLGTPRDVAGVVLFLAGPQATYVTGQAIVVDGGLTAQLPF